MSGHTRLYRRGAVYYHRAVVPQDIVATYGKREETFSLRTRDHAEALRRVRIEAVRVDRKFDEHRLRLTPAQIATIKATYLHQDANTIRTCPTGSHRVLAAPPNQIKPRKEYCRYTYN
ncbi:DUF6538 domain-containing protein [Yoonia maricola]